MTMGSPVSVNGTPMEIPTRDLAIAYPLPIADTIYWQFWRTCGFANNLVVSHFSVDSFAADEVEQAVPSIHAAARRMALRGADSYRVTGVPVLSALGRKRSLEVADEAAQLIGAPVGLDFEDTIGALKALDCRKFVLAAKWEPELMSKAVTYLSDAGLHGEAVSSVDFRPDSLWRIKTADGVKLALKLARDAVRKVEDADVLFLAGGSWLSVAAVPVLEQELGLPVVTNLNATYWTFMKDMGTRSPYDDVGRLFQI
jgi:maleate isomerase